METSDQRRRNAVERYELAEDEPTSTGVVTAVADVSGAEPVPTADAAEGTPTLEPLYTAVDPEALDALFEAGGSGLRDVTFAYHGYEVTVTADGRIRLERLERLE